MFIGFGYFIRVVLISIALIGNLPAYAWPPTFGTELNFTNTEILEDFRGRPPEIRTPTREVEQYWAEHLKKVIEVRCKEACTITKTQGKFFSEYKVTFKDGFYFNIAVDPAVVEIQISPLTLEQLNEQLPRIQKFVFDTAEYVGLNPRATGHLWVPMAAHLNIGAMSAFGDNPKAFLHYFADYANHPGLGLGILGSIDLHNAPPMNHLSSSQHEALQELIEKVNAGKWLSVPKIAKAINNNVYTLSPDHPEGRLSTAQHYQAIGLKYLNSGLTRANDKPMELRATRMPVTAMEYYLQAELTQRRMEYIRNSRDSILFIKKQARTDYSVAELAAEFYRYVKEMDVNWERYKDILDSDVRRLLNAGHIQKILEGEINWREATQVEMIKRQLANNVTISRWARANLLKAFSDPKLPAETASELMNQVGEVARSGFDHADAVQDFFGAVSKIPRFNSDASLKFRLEELVARTRTLSIRPPLRQCIWGRIRDLIRFR